MRLPGGKLEFVRNVFIRDLPYLVVGTLGSEERCTRVPIRMAAPGGQGLDLLQVNDPPGQYPNFTDLCRQKTEANRERLEAAGVGVTPREAELLASEDELLDCGRWLVDEADGRAVILDISSMPKRFFCFLLKHFVRSEAIHSLIVTYTSVAPQSYTAHQLALNPLQCDLLPGYAVGHKEVGGIVISVGFEPLSVASLFDMFSGEVKAEDVKCILPYPPNGIGSIRTWRTLRQVMPSAPQASPRLLVVSAWDAERVSRVCEQWGAAKGRLVLAPFGPKPHTLGMALSALAHGFGLYYTQPQVYDPNYSQGAGNSYAYVVKWRSVNCFDRP
jgi:hypothetical protein